MPLTILAQITAVSGHEDRVRAALEQLVAPTRAEAGCLFYDLHTDNNRPDFFVFYEAWETRDHWLAHNASAHIAAHQAATQGMVADVVISELTRLD